MPRACSSARVAYLLSSLFSERSCLKKIMTEEDIRCHPLASTHTGIYTCTNNGEMVHRGQGKLRQFQGHYAERNGVLTHGQKWGSRERFVLQFNDDQKFLLNPGLGSKYNQKEIGQKMKQNLQFFSL